MDRRRRRLIGSWWTRALLVLAAALALGSCSQLRSPSYDLGRVGCQPAPDATVAAAAKLTVPGMLRNGRIVKGGDGQNFLSAELHRPGEGRHAKGDLLTFEVASGDANGFLAMDVNARDDSSWRHSSLDMGVDGARESRACVDVARGKTKAQIECEQRQNTGSTPLPGDKGCADL
jgi:hypothetical protein